MHCTTKHCKFHSCSWWRVLDTTCHKACLWFTKIGQWSSLWTTLKFSMAWEKFKKAMWSKNEIAGGFNYCKRKCIYSWLSLSRIWWDHGKNWVNRSLTQEELRKYRKCSLFNDERETTRAKFWRDKTIIAGPYSRNDFKHIRCFCFCFFLSVKFFESCEMTDNF